MLKCPELLSFQKIYSQWKRIVFWLKNMTEDFLQFAWRTLSFRTQNLKTRNQESLRILEPGTWNRDQGPDFLNARIKWAGAEWNGQVEIHLHGDEWFRHGHHRDPMYNSVILHVVFEKGKEAAQRLDGTRIPELVLGNLLDSTVRSRYESLYNTLGEIPCKSLLNSVPASIRYTWYEVLFRERIFRKAESIRIESKDARNSWGQGYWMALAGYFGGILNGESFRQIAQQIPWKIIQKASDNLLQLQAIHLGMSGLLRREDYQDPYELSLQSEWSFLQKKNTLQEIGWLPLKYMRMRPAGFPDIRLAQLAAFIHSYPEPGYFEGLESWKKIQKQIPDAGIYWKNHHRLGIPTKSSQQGKAGKEFISLLLLNVLIPLSIAFRLEQGKAEIAPEEWNFIRSLAPEKNRITRLFSSCGESPQNALEAQAQIQLYKNYCLNKKCLSCAVGKYLIAGSGLSQEMLMEG
jgi:hypothetical protein